MDALPVHICQTNHLIEVVVHGETNVGEAHVRILAVCRLGLPRLFVVELLVAPRFTLRRIADADTADVSEEFRVGLSLP